MNKLLQVTGLILLFLSGIALAEENTSPAKTGQEEIDSYQGTYTIIGDKIIVEENISFLAYHSQYHLILPLDAKAIEVHSVNFELNPSKDYTEIVLKSNKLFKQFTLKYITESLIEESRDDYFILDLGELDAKRIQVNVILPEGAILKHSLQSPTPSIIPKTDLVQTNGRNVIISWNEKHIISNKAMMIIYDQPNSPEIKLLLQLTVIIVFIALGISLLFFRNKSRLFEKLNVQGFNLSHKFNKNKNSAEIITTRDSKKKEELLRSKEELTRNLFEEEKLIIEILFNAPQQELWQKQLALKTGLSKVKLSRKVRNLELKGLIEKIPYGNTNKIRLK
ncbi:hypothetical protein HYX12_03115 [Candidatus Woesearchaeota archaeon]|nr:hypothetical protein [Candidatus Woesearchaeota archaeon]